VTYIHKNKSFNVTTKKVSNIKMVVHAQNK
jgi:hypothetical protein